MFPSVFAHAEGVKVVVSIIYVLLALITATNFAESLCIDMFRFAYGTELLPSDIPWYSVMPSALQGQTYIFSITWIFMFKMSEYKYFIYVTVTLLTLVGMRRPWAWAINLMILIGWFALSDVLRFVIAFYMYADCKNNPWCWSQTAPYGYNSINTPNVYFLWYLYCLGIQVALALVLIVLLPGLKELVTKLVPDEELNGAIQVSAEPLLDSREMLEEEGEYDGYRPRPFDIDANPLDSRIFNIKALSVGSAMERKGLVKRPRKTVTIHSLLFMDVENHKDPTDF